MNAQAILKYLSWSVAPAQPAKKKFPPEAYTYDSPIEREGVSMVQEEANKVLDKQTWTVIETLGDESKR